MELNYFGKKGLGKTECALLIFFYFPVLKKEHSHCQVERKLWPSSCLLGIQQVSSVGGGVLEKIGNVMWGAPYVLNNVR